MKPLALIFVFCILLSFFGCTPYMLLPQEKAEEMFALMEKEGEESLSETAPPVFESSAHHIAGVPLLCQYPDFPTGCESVAAVAVLRYWGEESDVDFFVDFCLDIGEKFELRGGVLYGPDPYEAFVGSPRDPTSFGCMAPPIGRAMARASEDRLRILNLEGEELDSLCETYVSKDIPVLVWVTMGMGETFDGAEWYLPSGTLYTWPANEHCMVLVGYDEENYILMDPQEGTEVSYPKELVALRYGQMGKQAIAAIKE